MPASFLTIAAKYEPWCLAMASSAAARTERYLRRYHAQSVMRTQCMQTECGCAHKAATSSPGPYPMLDNKTQHLAEEVASGQRSSPFSVGWRAPVGPAKVPAPHAEPPCRKNDRHLLRDHCNRSSSGSPVSSNSRQAPLFCGTLGWAASTADAVGQEATLSREFVTGKSGWVVRNAPSLRPGRIAGRWARCSPAARG